MYKMTREEKVDKKSVSGFYGLFWSQVRDIKNWLTYVKEPAKLLKNLNSSKLLTGIMRLMNIKLYIYWSQIRMPKLRKTRIKAPSSVKAQWCIYRSLPWCCLNAKQPTEIFEDVGEFMKHISKQMIYWCSGHIRKRYLFI